MPVETVVLPSPQRFCAGVRMAIKALTWIVRAFEPTVYCYHAGASARERFVEDVVAHLAPSLGPEEVTAVAEDDYFPLPRKLPAPAPAPAIAGRGLDAANVLAAWG